MVPQLDLQLPVQSVPITIHHGRNCMVPYLNLQLPVQSVPITSKVVGSNPTHEYC
jgi:hypothetical protein